MCPIFEALQCFTDINRTSWSVPASDRNHDQGMETWTSPRLAEARQRPSQIEAISGHRYPLFFPPVMLLIAYGLLLRTHSMKLYALAFVILCTTSGLLHDFVSLLATQIKWRNAH